MLLMKDKVKDKYIDNNFCPGQLYRKIRSGAILKDQPTRYFNCQPGEQWG